MATVARGSSSLNPNAPLFIPAAFHKVEDFSPEWWELVKNLTWFQDYWLSQRREEDFVANADDVANNDIAYMQPEAFGLSMGEVEDFHSLQTEFQDFDMSNEAPYKVDPKPTAPVNGGRHQNGLEQDAVLQFLSKNTALPTPKWPKERHLKPIKPPQVLGYKCAPRVIHQPR